MKDENHNKKIVKTINISLPAELLVSIDQAAKHFYASRSEYIRHSVIQQMQIDADPTHGRQRTQKYVPAWAIKASQTEEFEFSDDYK